MFTGIVQGQGEVAHMRRKGQECVFVIRPLFTTGELEDGESIAVNGACLSVEKHDRQAFTAYASGETMARTNLGELAHGAKVNLERALAMGERVGGHIVSGHVDCVAILDELRQAGSSLCVRVSFPEEYSPQVVSKGSIALNGVSLTVNECGPGFLTVNIIPDSVRRTNIPQWTQGSRINMETDILGKYVEHILHDWVGRDSFQKTAGNQAQVTRDLLARNGFL